MENMDFNAFLNTLTEEQKTAVLACRTEEELQQVIDDYDIEIPDELLVGVAGGKGFLPVALATILLFATGCSSAPRKLAPAEVEVPKVQQVAAETAVAATEAATETALDATEAVVEATTENIAEKIAAAQKAADENASQQVAAAKKTAEENAAKQVAAAQKAAEEKAAAQVAAAQKAAKEEANKQAAAEKAAAEKAAKQNAAAQKAAEEGALSYVGVGYCVVSAEKLAPRDGISAYRIGVSPVSDRSQVMYLCSGYQFCITESEWFGRGVPAESQFFADKRISEGNVQNYVGTNYELVTSESLPSNDDSNYFKVGVARRGTNGPISYYYASRDFCMTESEWLNPATPSLEDDWQNPIMNFIGNYSNGRATLFVAAQGKNEAEITVSWSSNVFESDVWKMSGTVSQVGDTLVLNYKNCTRTYYCYTADGTLSQQTTKYAGGSGSITFSGSQAVWSDYQDGIADGQTFYFCGDTEDGPVNEYGKHPGECGYGYTG